MMLPEAPAIPPGHHKLGGYIRFINLSTGAIVRIRLPLFSNHCVLDSVDGILLLQRDEDTVIRLLHPFTDDIVDLPPLATLLAGLAPSQEKMFSWNVLRTVGATSFTVSADGVVTAMIGLFKLGRVACATTMDQRWRLSTWSISNGWRPLSFQGMYTLHTPTNGSELQIFQIDLPGHGEKEDFDRILCYLPAPKLIATCLAGKPQKPYYYLAECDSEILVIGRCLSGSLDVEVYRLSDIILDRIAPVTSIGGNALFVEERVLSVSSRVHPTIVGDSIVQLHNKEIYLGHYHLATGTWLPTADGNKGGLLYQGNVQPSWKVKRKWREGGFGINGSRVTEKEQGLNSFIYHAFLVAVALYFFKAVSDFKLL
uniref:KIB1-4 beta-propeller domain-containing protein n=1 Tax=Aegilops tauschii TaxID=37682 RepID=R7W3A7_AEGTA